MRYFIFLSVALYLTFCLTAPQTHASFWIKCEVDAEIISQEDVSRYKIKINAATPIDGHSSASGQCLSDKIGTQQIVKSEAPWPVGEDSTLYYTLYSGVGPNGTLRDEKWSISP